MYEIQGQLLINGKNFLSSYELRKIRFGIIK